MKKQFLAIALAALAGTASAHEVTYNITATWFEPMTQPRDSIFKGSFVYDEHTGAVSNLQGLLSESMTGSGDPADMTWLSLTNQLVTWHDATLGGTFAAAFKNANTNTFTTNPAFGGTDGWTPGSGFGLYYGFPAAGANPGNAYALIFVPDGDPTAALTKAQLDKIAYADCAPGGMMGATCMTGTSVAGWGTIGTMDGVPHSQVITAAVPEPATYALLLAGLGLVGSVAARRRVPLDRAGAALQR